MELKDPGISASSELENHVTLNVYEEYSRVLKMNVMFKKKGKDLMSGCYLNGLFKEVLMAESSISRHIRIEPCKIARHQHLSYVLCQYDSPNPSATP